MQLISQLQNFIEQLKEEISREAQRLMKEPMPEITEQLFTLFEETGNRTIFEQVYFTRRKYLTVFGLKALLEQQESGPKSGKVQEETLQEETLQEEILQDLTKVMGEICKEECWALPAHVDRTQQNWRVTVDLFAAETAQTLAELADRLQTQLPQETYDQIVSQIRRRIFDPFFSSKVGEYGWECAEHNWNAVILGSIGSACLHLMRGSGEVLESCLDRICQGLSHYVDGFAEDGTCMEGLDYYNYGMNFFVNFAQELYEYTQGERDLLCGEWAGFQAGASDKRVRMAAFWPKCYFPDGSTVSFSDGNRQEKFRMGLGCVLARRFSQPFMPDLEQAADLHFDTCYRFVPLKMDLFGTKAYVEYLQSQEKDICSGTKMSPNRSLSREKPEFHVLEKAQWCIAGSQNGVGMACKGGHNNEPHNHNDVGHFIYEAGGCFFFTDLGAGEYTKDYFGEGRYGILCNNSFGHSLPVIGGAGESAGKSYGCTSFEAERTTELGRIKMELAGAYAEGLVEHFQRNLTFDLSTGGLIVQDLFVVPKRSDPGIVENLVTQILPEVAGNQIILKKDKKRAILTLNRSCVESKVKIKSYEHRNHLGRVEPLYGIQWQVPVTDGRGIASYEIEYRSQ